MIDTEGNNPEYEIIGKEVVDSAIKIHRLLGPGLLESAYQEIMAYELRQRGFSVECEVSLPIVYGDQKISIGYRIDMLRRFNSQVQLKG
ncbi:MAG: GxxExxY protein [Anaerolineaceae bacterium]